MNSRPNAPAQPPNYLFLILLASFLLRVVGISRPLLGNFSSVQIIYAMMARNYRDYSWNLFLPRLDILMFTGEPGIRFLDLPLISYGVAILSKFTSLPIDFLGRAWSGIFSLGCILLFYKLVLRWFNEITAKISTFIFACSPLLIIYGQSFQTDVTSLFFLLLSLLILEHGLSRIRVTGAAIFFALVILQRIQFIFLYPVFILTFSRDKPQIVIFLTRCIFFVFISLLPFLMWYAFIYHYLQAHYDSIIMSISHQFQAKIYQRYGLMSFQFWIPFLKHLVSLVINPFGFICFIFGIRQVKTNGILLAWLSFGLLMLLALNQKAIDMNYYYLLLVPPFAITASLWIRQYLPIHRLPLYAFLWLALSLLFSAAPAYKTPAFQKYIPTAAERVKKFTNPNDLIIASNDSNLDLLYYTERKGWTFQITDREKINLKYWEYLPDNINRSRIREEYIANQKNTIEAFEFLLKQGAEYFVCTRVSELISEPVFYPYLTKHYSLVHQSSEVLIFKLNK